MSARRSGRPLQIMYRVDGSPRPHRGVAGAPRGLAGSRPVRIGNGAADQLQLDIYGEAMDSVYLGDATSIAHEPRRLAEHRSISSTGSATTGTSPTRASGRPAAASRTSPTGGSCRGWPSTERYGWPTPGLPADTADGRRARPVYEQIMDAGWNPRAGASSSTTTPTCSTPRCSTCRSSASSRPSTRCGSRRCGPWTRSSSRTASSTATTRSASPDGLRGSEGTFSICTFWYVDALARSGRLEDARLTFDKMLTYANHARPVLGGDRTDGRAAGQLPAGVQPPLADQRGGQPRLPARPRRRFRRVGARRDPTAGLRPVATRRPQLDDGSGAAYLAVSWGRRATTTWAGCRPGRSGPSARHGR